jgi:hypothetical protein
MSKKNTKSTKPAKLPVGSKPSIDVRKFNLVTAVNQAESLLAETDSLQYFRRGADIVKPYHVRKNTEQDGVKRHRGGILVLPVSKETIVRDVMTNADCYTYNYGKWSRTEFPDKYAIHVLDSAHNGHGNYRRLEIITNTPVLLPDGTILTAPGYHNGVLMVPSNISYPDVPATVSQEQAKVALRKFARVYGCYPFRKETPGQDCLLTPSYSVVLASILSLVARPSFPIVPLFGITAPRRGFGKTKIAESATAAALGYKPTLIHFCDPVEFNKLLVPVLSHADRSILIDNIEVPFHSGMLNAILTSDQPYTARILGKSKDVTLINTGVFFATGNQLALKGDITRRSLMITLEGDFEFPEEREFAFDPVTTALALHPELCIAALTALRGFIQAGRPWVLDRSPLADYCEWDYLITGTLTWLGFADPYITRNSVEQSDPQREADLELLSVWYQTYPEPVTVFDIQQPDLAGEHSMVWHELCPDGKWNRKEIDYRLRSLKDRVLGGYKLQKLPTLHDGRTQWIVTKDGKWPDKPAVMPPSICVGTAESGDGIRTEVR